MSLRFQWQQIADRSRALTYDDVLIVPQKLNMRSRRDPNLGTQFTKKHKLTIPLIAANMDTVSESEMMIAMHKLGGVAILHRFMTIEEQVNEMKKARDAGVSILSASVGVNAEYMDRAKALIGAGANVLTIDIAHGHSIAMLETMKDLKNAFPDVEIVAGNIATPEAAQDLIEAGADAIKVGIGPGSMCTTRIITGCGVPQLTAVALCAEVAKSNNVPLIADGGVKTSGDIVKALCAGAESVMLGSLLAGTLESPGEIKSGKKQYRGMASKAAQNSWRGGVPEGMAAEGEATMINIKGHTKDVVNELCGGIRSGMTYVDAGEIHEMCKKAFFVEMSSAGYFESRAHGVKN
ncbi:MAG: guanosine monophosphate reductase [Bdellovibrionales bacterium]|nr:guanosine monophosphate reductase [Bdellovibrionales bacterium]